LLTLRYSREARISRLETLGRAASHEPATRVAQLLARRRPKGHGGHWSDRPSTVQAIHGARRMSISCHKRSFDHLVGAKQERLNEQNTDGSGPPGPSAYVQPLSYCATVPYAWTDLRWVFA